MFVNCIANMDKFQTGMTGLSPDVARAISQDLLDRSGQAYLTGDFDAFADCFAFPHRITTFDGTTIVPDRDALHDIFVAVRDHFAANRLTDIVRPCIDASFADADTVKATHESRYLSGYRLIQRPAVCLSTIRWLDGVWRVADGQYAIQDADCHVRALMRPRQRATSVVPDRDAATD